MVNGVQLAKLARCASVESESESDDDDYSKDPSYKPSGRSSYAARRANTREELKCQFIYEDGVECSYIGYNNGFCYVHV